MPTSLLFQEARHVVSKGPPDNVARGFQPFQLLRNGRLQPATDADYRLRTYSLDLADMKEQLLKNIQTLEDQRRCSSADSTIALHEVDTGRADAAGVYEFFMKRQQQPPQTDSMDPRNWLLLSRISVYLRPLKLQTCVMEGEGLQLRAPASAAPAQRHRWLLKRAARLSTAEAALQQLNLARAALYLSYFNGGLGPGQERAWIVEGREERSARGISLALIDAFQDSRGSVRFGGREDGDGEASIPSSPEQRAAQMLSDHWLDLRDLLFEHGYSLRDYLALVMEYMDAYPASATQPPEIEFLGTSSSHSIQRAQPGRDEGVYALQSLTPGSVDSWNTSIVYSLSVLPEEELKRPAMSAAPLRLTADGAGGDRRSSLVLNWYRVPLSDVAQDSCQPLSEAWNQEELGGEGRHPSVEKLKPQESPLVLRFEVNTPDISGSYTALATEQPEGREPDPERLRDPVWVLHQPPEAATSKGSSYDEKGGDTVLRLLMRLHLLNAAGVSLLNDSKLKESYAGSDVQRRKELPYLISARKDYPGLLPQGSLDDFKEELQQLQLQSEVLEETIFNGVANHDNWPLIRDSGLGFAWLVFHEAYKAFPRTPLTTIQDFVLPYSAKEHSKLDEKLRSIYDSAKQRRSLPPEWKPETGKLVWVHSPEQDPFLAQLPRTVLAHSLVRVQNVVQRLDILQGSRFCLDGGVYVFERPLRDAVSSLSWYTPRSRSRPWSVGSSIWCGVMATARDAGLYVLQVDLKGPTEQGSYRVEFDVALMPRRSRSQELQLMNDFAAEPEAYPISADYIQMLGTPRRPASLQRFLGTTLASVARLAAHPQQDEYVLRLVASLATEARYGNRETNLPSLSHYHDRMGRLLISGEQALAAVNLFAVPYLARAVFSAGRPRNYSLGLGRPHPSLSDAFQKDIQAAAQLGLKLGLQLGKLNAHQGLMREYLVVEEALMIQRSDAALRQLGAGAESPFRGLLPASNWFLQSGPLLFKRHPEEAVAQLLRAIQALSRIQDEGTQRLLQSWLGFDLNQKAKDLGRLHQALSLQGHFDDLPASQSQQLLAKEASKPSAAATAEESATIKLLFESLDVLPGLSEDWLSHLQTLELLANDKDERTRAHALEALDILVRQTRSFTGGRSSRPHSVATYISDTIADQHQIQNSWLTVAIGERLRGGALPSQAEAKSEEELIRVELAPPAAWEAYAALKLASLAERLERAPFIMDALGVEIKELLDADRARQLVTKLTDYFTRNYRWPLQAVASMGEALYEELLQAQEAPQGLSSSDMTALLADPDDFYHFALCMEEDSRPEPGFQSANFLEYAAGLGMPGLLSTPLRTTLERLETESNTDEQRKRAAAHMSIRLEQLKGVAQRSGFSSAAAGQRREPSGLYDYDTMASSFSPSDINGMRLNPGNPEDAAFIANFWLIPLLPVRLPPDLDLLWKEVGVPPLQPLQRQSLTDSLREEPAHKLALLRAGSAKVPQDFKVSGEPLVQPQPDQSVKSTGSDGSSQTVMTDGSSLTETANGTVVKTDSAGNISVTTSDGSHAERDPEGNLSQPTPNSLLRVDAKTGVTTVSWPQQGVTMKLKPTRESSTQLPGGSSISKAEDGTLTHTDPQGEVTPISEPTTYNPSQEVQLSTDPQKGSMTLTLLDGSSADLGPDNSLLLKNPTGSSLELPGKGGILIGGPAGDSVRISTKGAVEIQTSQNVTLSSSAPDPEHAQLQVSPALRASLKKLGIEASAPPSAAVTVAATVPGELSKQLDLIISEPRRDPSKGYIEQPFLEEMLPVAKLVAEAAVKRNPLPSLLDDVLPGKRADVQAALDSLLPNLMEMLPAVRAQVVAHQILLPLKRGDEPLPSKPLSAEAKRAQLLKEGGLPLKDGAVLPSVTSIQQPAPSVPSVSALPPDEAEDVLPSKQLQVKAFERNAEFVQQQLDNLKAAYLRVAAQAEEAEEEAPKDFLKIVLEEPLASQIARLQAEVQAGSKSPREANQELAEEYNQAVANFEEIFIPAAQRLEVVGRAVDVAEQICEDLKPWIKSKLGPEIRWSDLAGQLDVKLEEYAAAAPAAARIGIRAERLYEEEPGTAAFKGGIKALLQRNAEALVRCFSEEDYRSFREEPAFREAKLQEAKLQLEAELQQLYRTTLQQLDERNYLKEGSPVIAYYSQPGKPIAQREAELQAARYVHDQSKSTLPANDPRQLRLGQAIELAAATHASRLEAVICGRMSMPDSLGASSINLAGLFKYVGELFQGDGSIPEEVLQAVRAAGLSPEAQTSVQAWSAEQEYAELLEAILGALSDMTADSELEAPINSLRKKLAEGVAASSVEQPFQATQLAPEFNRSVRGLAPAIQLQRYREKEAPLLSSLRTQAAARKAEALWKLSSPSSVVPEAPRKAARERLHAASYDPLEGVQAQLQPPYDQEEDDGGPSLLGELEADRPKAERWYMWLAARERIQELLQPLPDYAAAVDAREDCGPLQAAANEAALLQITPLFKAAPERDSMEQHLEELRKDGKEASCKSRLPAAALLGTPPWDSLTRACNGPHWCYNDIDLRNLVGSYELARSLGGDELAADLIYRGLSGQSSPSPSGRLLGEAGASALRFAYANTNLGGTALGYVTQYLSALYDTDFLSLHYDPSGLNKVIQRLQRPVSLDVTELDTDPRGCQQEASLRVPRVLRYVLRDAPRVLLSRGHLWEAYVSLGNGTTWHRSHGEGELEGPLRRSDVMEQLSSALLTLTDSSQDVLISFEAPYRRLSLDPRYSELAAETASHDKLRAGAKRLLLQKLRQAAALQAKQTAPLYRRLQQLEREYTEGEQLPEKSPLQEIAQASSLSELRELDMWGAEELYHSLRGLNLSQLSALPRRSSRAKTRLGDTEDLASRVRSIVKTVEIEV